MPLTPHGLSRVRPVVAALIRLRPSPPRYRTATIAAVCTLAPLLLAEAGLLRPAWGALGSLGALAALYGGPGRPVRDALAVGAATLGLAGGFLVGSIAQGRPWLSVPVVAIWAAVVTAACAWFEARPPGIAMPVLSGAVATGLPSQNPLPPAAVITAVGALATVLVWMTAALRDQRHGPIAPARQVAVRLPGPVPLWPAFRTAIGIAAGGSLALLTGFEHAYWAMATAASVLTTGNHGSTVRERALLRGAGTLAGCLIAGAVLALHPAHLVLAIVLALSAFTTECVVARNYALAMISVTPTALLLVALAAPPTLVPWALTGDRMVETVLGCLAAIVAGQLVTAGWAVRQRVRAVTAVLAAVAEVRETRARNGPADEAVAVLARRLRRLDLVTTRTAGERRAVHGRVEDLDDLIGRTKAAAEAAISGTGEIAGELAELVAISRLRLEQDRSTVAGNRNWSWGNRTR